MRLTNRRSVVRMDACQARRLAVAIGRAQNGFGMDMANVRNAVARSLRVYSMAGAARLSDALLYSRFAAEDIQVARDVWTLLNRMRKAG